jgi:sulfonate transport system substrate-binding protein
MHASMLARRGLLIGAGAGALISGGLAACGKAETSAPLRLATYRGNVDSFFAAAGVPDPPGFSRAQFASGVQIAEAINARAIDVGGMSEIPPIFLAGAPSNLVRLVAVLQGDVNNQVVLTPKGSPIRTLADLKGKTVGYVRATTSHYILLRLLKEAGLSWGDIKPAALSPQDGLAAFQRGGLDAWVIYGVIVQQARAAGAQVLTTGLNRLSGNYVVATSSEALADPARRRAVGDYLRRYRKVLDWVNADDERWAKARAEVTGVPIDYYRQEARERSARPALLPVTAAAIASQQAVADAFAEAGVLSHKVDVSPLWDTRLNDGLKG